MRLENAKSGEIVWTLTERIRSNRDYLSEIDGLIGDGDHGINMSKGFTLCANKLSQMTYSLSTGLQILGQTLLEDIGGSMGPLYGVFFDELASESEDYSWIDEQVFLHMLQNAVEGVKEIGSAKQGDKTLLDTLIPALNAYQQALEDNMSFYDALTELRKAAKNGWQSTKDMVARVGRASRLGERSRGVLDAGATSCYIILDAMAECMQKLLKEEES